MGDDPLVLAVAPETHGAVLLTEGLPTVSDLLTQHGLAARGQQYLDLWWQSWELGLEEGKKVRHSVYPSASNLLYPRLGEDGVSRLLDRNRENLRAAQAVEVLLVADAVNAAMENARSAHEQAIEALEDGRGEAALALALRSADAVREVSPLEVARALIQRATEALGRKGEALPYSQEELIRIRRLTNGAEEALESGDYPRAIRRAYYACQLLGVGPG